MTLSQQHTTQGHVRGWILPSVLFSIAILSALAALLVVESLSVGRASQTLHRARVERESFKRALLPVAKTISGCETRNIPSSSNTISLELCRDEHRPFILSLPDISLPQQRIDYDTIFSSPQRCPITPRPTRSLTTDAPTASFDCVITSTGPAGLVVVDNISSSSLTVSSSPPTTPFLATPGRFTVTDDLRVSHDLVILAGGDVAIPHIRGISTGTIRVTIVSSLGRIDVGSLSGPISLLAIGRSLLNVPHTETVPPFPLPPMRPLSLRGITSVWNLRQN